VGAVKLIALTRAIRVLAVPGNRTDYNRADCVHLAASALIGPGSSDTGER
jgi:hypothetical protein